MKQIKKIFSVFTTLACALIALFAILLVGVRLVGLTPLTVISGSMEPNIHVGSVIYVKKAAATDFKVNDCITYRLGNGTPVTHRIIEVIPDEKDPSYLRFRTQGDANDIPDSTPVEPINIIGKPLFSIPWIGYAVHYVQSPPGLYVMIGAIAGIILITLLLEFFSPSEKEAEEN